MVIIGIVFYIIMSIGCAIALIKKWSFNEVIACAIVGVSWPIWIATKFFRWINSL